MVHYTCDMCGKALLVDESVRYVVKVQVYVAYDQMEITEEDLERDRFDEMEQVLDEMEDMTSEEVEEGVYKSLRFDLCPACQSVYLDNPLFHRQGRRINFGEN